MASASEEHQLPAHGGEPSKSDLPEDDQEAILVQKWVNQRKRLVGMKLRMDALQSRIELMEKRLSSVEFLRELINKTSDNRAQP